MNITEHGTIAVGAPGSAMRRITEHPEPTEEPRTRYDVSTDTPWGSAQSAMYFAEGVIFYGTASHGGFHLSKSVLKRVPLYLRIADKYADGMAGWYEEDCASAIVVICFPELFKRDWRDNAVRTMQSTYPKQWEEFCKAR